MTKEEEDLIIAEQNKSTKEILKAIEQEKCELLGIIQGKDKVIKDLEQKLEQTEKDLTDYQFNYPKIKDLEKENERLRTRCEQARDEGTGYMQQLEEENAEAKEIIRHLLLLPYANNEEVFADVTSILNKAEQFISEVEK